jgi:hypothetical protein
MAATVGVSSGAVKRALLVSGTVHGGRCARPAPLVAGRVLHHHEDEPRNADCCHHDLDE